MFRKYFILFFVLSYQIILAQIGPEQKDRILKQIHSNEQDKPRLIDYLLKNYYVYNELDSVDYYCNRLLLISQNKDKQKYKGNIHYYLATKYAYSGNYTQALSHLKNAIMQHQNVQCDSCLVADYNLLSLIYTKNNKPKDFEYGFKALKMSEKIKDTTGMIEAMKNIAMFYAERENPAMKDVYLSKIRLILNKYDSVIPSQKYRLLAIYHSTKKPDSTIYYLQKAIDFDQKIKCKRCLSLDYFYLAETQYFFTGDIRQAIRFNKKALNLSQQVFKPLSGSILNALAKNYYKINNFKKAIQYAHLAKDALLIENDWDTLEETASLLFESYYKIKKYDSAYWFVNQMLNYRDSLYLKKIEVTSIQLNAQYETEKKQLQIEKLQLKQQKDKQIKLLLSAGLVLVLFSLLLLWRSFYLGRKKIHLEKELLESEKEKIEQDLQHKSRELTSQALMILQKNKLIKEILQSLSAIKNTGDETHKKISDLKRLLKRNMHSDKDWELFRQYFEQVNKNFFIQLKKNNAEISPSELKLAALIKLGFSIKESASLLNISEGSVKTARYQLRKKLGLKRQDNLYDFLNAIT